MQPQSQLNLQLKPGSPSSAVPRKWFMFINNVLRFLTVQNGRLIANNDKWTLVCGSGGGVWSGFYWYGGEEFEAELDDLKTYFGCDLRTGEVQFADEPTDSDNIEWRHVANKTTINEGTPEEEDVYTLSNRTCGDIVFRIT
jgi:hypothetical protein